MTGYQRRRYQRQPKQEDIAWKVFKIVFAGAGALILAWFLFWFLFSFGCSAVIYGIQNASEAVGR